MPRLVRDVSTDPVLSHWVNNRSPAILSSAACFQSAAYCCKVSSLVPAPYHHDRHLNHPATTIAVVSDKQLFRDNNPCVTLSRPMETLYVPVFRRGQFVLGEMLGVGSPNVSVVKLFHPTPINPISIARRFVADLGSSNCIKFIEYEWFENSILVVVRHCMYLNGNYVAHYSLFVPGSNPTTAAAAASFAVTEASPVVETRSRLPTTIGARVSVREAPDCPSCVEQDVACSCPQERPPSVVPILKDGVWSWSQWINAFHNLFSGKTTCWVSANIVGAHTQQQVRNDFGIRHTRSSTFGDAWDTRANILCRQYATLISMNALHPSADNRLVHRHRAIVADSSGATKSETTSVHDTRSAEATSSGGGGTRRPLRLTVQSAKVRGCRKAPGKPTKKRASCSSHVVYAPKRARRYQMEAPSSESSCAKLDVVR